MNILKTQKVVEFWQQPIPRAGSTRRFIQGRKSSMKGTSPSSCATGSRTQISNQTPMQHTCSWKKDPEDIKA
jgi:hypothetical protein